MRVNLGITERPITATEPDIGLWINRDLLPLLRQLRASANEASDDIDAGVLPAGAAGGQLGGTYPNPDVRGVRETTGPTLLTMGAVADGQFLKRSGATVVGGTPVGTEGSIFSMTAPGGATAPVVVYDFANFYDASASDAANVTAANRSGDSSLNLTIVGGALPRFLTNSGVATEQMPFALTPFAVGSAGGALISGAAGTDYVTTAGSPAALRFQTAMTAEWLGYVMVAPTAGAGDIQFINYTGAGETEDVNSQYLLFWRDSDNAMLYLHESGAGLDSEAGFFNGPETIFAPTLAIPMHLCLTRAAGGTATLYVNSRLAAPPGVPGPASALPTGGTASNLRIGQGGNTAVRLATLAVRLFGVQLTAAQARESYQRTMFGVAV